MSATAVASSTRDRLVAAVRDVEDARARLAVALERRDALIVTARDEGMSQQAIAHVVGVSPPHVLRVLASAEPGLVLPS